MCAGKVHFKAVATQMKLDAEGSDVFMGKIHGPVTARVGYGANPTEISSIITMF